MAAKDFKPLYKSEYTSQGTLINQVFPNEVVEILGYIKAMEAKVDFSVITSIGWFAANLPPYKKFFKDYDNIQTTLQECRDLFKQWRKDDPNGKQFPIQLKQKISYLYEQWWEAYNESGAGIRGNIFIPREQRVKDAIRNL